MSSYLSLGLDPFSFLIGSVFLLTLICLGLVRRINALKKSQQDKFDSMQHEIDEINGELRALIKADFGVGKRLIQVEHQLTNLEERQEDLSLEMETEVECQQVSGLFQEADFIFDENEELSKEEQSLMELMSQTFESIEEETP